MNNNTPETDAEAFKSRPPFYFVPADFARNLERQRDEARELLASEKSTRNAIIAKGIEMERQLAEAREENARLRGALQKVFPFIDHLSTSATSSGHLPMCPECHCIPAWNEAHHDQCLYGQALATLQHALTP